MLSEIFVEDRKIDISADISSLLTFALDDVKDFSARSTTFSKTVVVPGTLKNNILFGNIFEFGISNGYDPNQPNIAFNFNASKSARAYIFQDNLQTFKGTIRLLEIVKDKGRIEYEVALNGELTSLSVALSAGLLEDLDFSAYDHLYNISNIIASWDNAGGSGYYYPLVDYGTYSTNKHDWDVFTFRPALYAKEYIDKMFAAANFRYQSDLFETDRFKKLIVPHNQKTLLSTSGEALSAKLITVDRTVIDSGSGTTINKIDFDTIVAGGFTYSLGTFTYTQPDSISIDLNWRIDGQRKATVASGTFIVYLRKNGVPIASQNFTAPFTPMGSFFNFGWISSITTTLATGDTLDFTVQYLTGSGVIVIINKPNTEFTGQTNNNVPLPIAYNGSVTLNDSIPKNIRQVDFLLSIVKLFNLYVYEDKFDERLIKFAPYINFYTTNSTESLNWSYKMDRDQVQRLKPMSELNSKLYRFKYKDDNDYYNELYKKRYNVGYGSYTFDSEFEFTSNENSLELIFASTPLVGYNAEEKVYPTIFKRTGPDTAPVEERVDSVIRLMQTKKVTGVASYAIKNGVSTLATVTAYPYAGHFDDPDNPQNDLNFGALEELFFELVAADLSKTQFNVYWSSYMAEITDKDSKMLVAKFYLTPKDIFNLDFSKYIMVDGVLWRLNKITDYNASTPDTCEVQLLRVINTTYTETVPIPGETYLLKRNDTDYLIDKDGSRIKLF